MEWDGWEGGGEIAADYHFDFPWFIALIVLLPWPEVTTKCVPVVYQLTFLLVPSN